MAFRMNISRSGTIIAVSTRLWPDADFSFLTLPIRRRIRFSNLKFSQTSLPNRREHQPHSQNPWGVKYPRDRWCKERKEKAPILSLPLAENIKRLLRSIAPDG